MHLIFPNSNLHVFWVRPWGKKTVKTSAYLRDHLHATQPFVHSFIGSCSRAMHFLTIYSSWTQSFYLFRITWVHNTLSYFGNISVPRGCLQACNAKQHALYTLLSKKSPLGPKTLSAHQYNSLHSFADGLDQNLDHQLTRPMIWATEAAACMADWTAILTQSWHANLSLTLDQNPGLGTPYKVGGQAINHYSKWRLTHNGHTQTMKQLLGYRNY